MISTYDFVRRAVATGKRHTINDHLTLQNITEPQARRSKRTIMHRELKQEGLYHDLLGTVFVPSKSSRGRLPDIADLVDAEDDTLNYTPTKSRFLALINPVGYNSPTTTDRVGNSQEVMMSLPLSKQAAIADGFLAQQQEFELEKVKREAAEREAKTHLTAVTRMEEMLGAFTQVIQRLGPPSDNDASVPARRRG